MKRILIIACKSVVVWALCHSSSAAPPSSATFAGTYRVENIDDKHSVPTNFFEFSLTLNADGSFVATNVPADFFFHYPPTPARPGAKGTWSVEHRSEGRSFFYTGENDYLNLKFTTAPGPGSWSQLIQSDMLGAPWIRMDYHSGKSDAMLFNLKRVKR
jgi:hypothetical protein